MMFFGLGGIFYFMVLVTNAIAILSEDRFLARIGWSASSAAEPAFGAGPGGDASVKSKIVNLIASVRTLMRMIKQRFVAFYDSGDSTSQVKLLKFSPWFGPTAAAATPSCFLLDWGPLLLSLRRLVTAGILLPFESCYLAPTTSG
ncbi:hypothetical protein VE01_06891 [Pseudogymnoascus verrucosus]|uniref:Protein transport protein yos1 n=1 Tax=Pseudogymnoascus verrucosus TaxID=342668 RepID=A0A1B8GK92_9PEZI|nr:uncharacterized protein VE01_06891 [Pseudogymnoascus verrucosus]OBT96206.1 hypothetical protein VE01_06891 [Pseudogymnoascus verrucosus]